MAEQYYLIPQINRNSKNWTVRVTLTEDIVPMKTTKSDLKRYVFTDEEGNQIIAAAYGADIPKLISQLRLFKVYDITNAYVSEVKPEFRILNNRYQWNLEKKTLITEVSQAEPNLRYFLDNIIPLSLISNYLDDRNKTVDIMGIIIKVDEVKTVLCERGELPVQTFTFLDSEKKTMKVSIWEHMTVNQSPILITAARNHSVVVAKRLAIKRFEGGTLNAKNSSSFAIDPPIRAATELKEWFESVQEIELSGWLADANDTIEISRKNVDSGIMKTHTVLEVVKAIESGDYWVRGYLQIAEEDQKLTYNACSSCTRSINIAEGKQYTCRYCNKEVLAIPKPIVIVSIRDHTGIINAAAITTVAEKILQTTASEIARLNKLGQDYDLETIKEELHGKYFKMLLRRKYRGSCEENKRPLLVAYFTDDIMGSSSNELPISPLKRQLNECKINAGDRAKRQLLMFEESQEQETQGSIEISEANNNAS